MREINFRFWSNHLNKFVAPDDSIFVGALKDPDMNPMQYTGLKDKNGREIYEGDIVKDVRGGDVDVIVWNSEYPSFQVREAESPWASPLNSHFVKARCEIIGNIYESPELLK